MTGRWGMRLSARHTKNNPRFKRDGSGLLQKYGTPWYLVRWLEQEEGRPFDGDCCAEAWSAKARQSYSGAPDGIDGLTAPWWALTWCNPPWAIQGRWLQRAAELARTEGVTTYCLVLASTSAAYWRPTCFQQGTVDFFEGRISFLHPSTHEPVPGFDRANALVTFGPRVRPGLVRVRRASTGELIHHVLPARRAA